MKRLTCEMCGSTDLIKQDGVFVCQTCGCKYSIEEAKKMMVEGTVEVTGTVKVDNSAAIENYLDMARNAIDAGNNKEADEYCNKIIEMDTANWEAWLIKGRAVGWQSTLGNNRVGETINAFSKALENCPEDMKDTLGEQCKLRLGELQTAMLMTRIKCFKPHPSVHDVEGLKSDVSSIITTTLNFLAKANIKVDAIGNVNYARIVNNGICDAWNDVYSNYKGDEGYPTDYEFKNFLEEGNCLIDALKLALVLCGSENGNKVVDDLKVQIYNNLIHIQTELMNGQSYEVSFDGGYKHYNRNLYLADGAKKLRQNEIDEWNRGISEVRMAEKEIAQKVEEARRKAEQEKIAEYWAAHPEVKSQIEELEVQRDEVTRRLSEVQVELNRKKENLNNLPSFILREQKHHEAEQLKERIQKLGFFQGKEKKRLQEQLKGLSGEMEQLTKAAASEKFEAEKELEPLNAKLDQLNGEISELTNKIAKLKAGASIFATFENEKTEEVEMATERTACIEEEKVDAILVRVGPGKMQVIKIIKEITGLDLKTTTDIVNGAPKAVKENISRDEAEKIKQKLESVGATIEVK